MKNAFLIIIALFCLTSCNKDDFFSSKTIKADIFQCCNIWQSTEDNTMEEETIEAFLEERNIDFKGLEIVDNGGPGVYCAICCGCPTTLHYEFKVREKDLDKILDLGFTL